MESKIMIDINYASREPQVVISQRDSEDPRDKLISMFTGGSMPGVREGYCRIERYSELNVESKVVITPVHPVDLIDHIPLIAKFAEENVSCDTSEVPGKYRKVIEDEYERLRIGGVQKAEPSELWILGEMNVMCAESLDPERFDKWESVREELRLRRRALKKDDSDEPAVGVVNPDKWAQENLSPDLYRKWRKDVFGQEYKLKSEAK
jgi:hypothetical protein